jgi:hemerythrin superfamily protein
MARPLFHREGRIFQKMKQWQKEEKKRELNVLLDKLATFSGTWEWDKLEG